MEQYESAPLFKADNATLSFYATKDGKISVSYQGWDQSKTVLAGQIMWTLIISRLHRGSLRRFEFTEVESGKHAFRYARN